MDMEALLKNRQEMEGLYIRINDPLFLKFFDFESDEHLPEKILVMKDLVEGKTPSEIPLYYDVLELLPEDGEHWDY